MTGDEWDGMWDGAPGWYVQHRAASNEIAVGLAPEDEDYDAVWQHLSEENALALVAALKSALRLVGSLDRPSRVFSAAGDPAHWDVSNAPRASIVNMAMHPTKASRPLPRSRWRRALLALRGYELYGP